MQTNICLQMVSRKLCFRDTIFIPHVDKVLLNLIKADDRTRTDNLLITNQLLCQLSHIGLKKWDLQGSNLWPSACKADALPAELRPHIVFMQFTNFVSLLLTTQKRLELSTSAVTGRRSNQLSHWAIFLILKWTFGDSNPGPTGYEPVALTNWAKGPKWQSRWSDSNR